MLGNFLKNDRGSTLVEAVVSIALITLALVSFYHLYIQSHSTAKYNNDKLVAINMAEAELERIKLTPFDTGYLPPIDPASKYNQTIDVIGKEIYTGGDQYDLNITATQNDQEKINKLINVIVSVKYNGKESTVEGYVRYE